MTDPARQFHGAKLVLLVGPHLLVLRRDHDPSISWPGYLDLPGGGRDDDETPEACVLRETAEEFGLSLARRRVHRAVVSGGGRYFVGMLPVAARSGIRFGDEGQGWMLMPPDAFVRRGDAVPHLRKVVARALRRRQKKPGRGMAGPGKV